MKILILLLALQAQAEFFIEAPSASTTMPPPVEFSGTRFDGPPAYSFTQPEVDALSKMSLGDTVYLPGQNGDVYEVVLVGREGNHFKFQYKDTLPRSEWENRAAAPAPESRGSSPAPGIPAAGNAAAPGVPTYSFGDYALNAGKAAAGAAVITGITNGIVNSPAQRRSLERQQQKTMEAERQVQESVRAFRQEHEANQKKLAKEAEFTRQKMKEYQAPEFARGKSSAFQQTSVGRQVDRVRADMSRFTPANETQQNLKDLANFSGNYAELNYHEGKAPEAKVYADLAEGFADMALGLDPYTGMMRDGYEFLTGKNLVTGAALSNLERALAGAGFGLGLGTMGLGSSAIHGLEAAAKMLGRYGKLSLPLAGELKALASYGQSLGASSANAFQSLVDFSRRTLKSQVGAVGNVRDLILRGQNHFGKWADAFDLHKVQTAAQANAEYLKKFPTHKPPYRAGTVVVDGVLREDTVFIRLHSSHNQQSSWIVRGEAIDKSLSASELRIKYSLPQTPELISEVTVRKGTLLRRSKAAPAFGGGENAVQYQILDPLDWNRAVFGEAKRLYE